MGKNSLNSCSVNIDEKLSPNRNESSAFKLYVEVYVYSICMTFKCISMNNCYFTVLLKGHLFLKWIYMKTINECILWWVEKGVNTLDREK